MEVAEDNEEEEAATEVPAIAAFELSRQAPVIEAVESEEEEEQEPAEEQAELPSFAAQVESDDTKRIVWPPFEDEEEEEATPAETPSHSYALSQSSSEPKTDDYRNRETEHFRF